MQVRRVVTGHDGTGRSVFVGDDLVDPAAPVLMPGSEFHRLWGADDAPRFPGDGSMPPHASYFPPVGGMRFGMFTLPPQGEGPPAGVDVAEGLKEIESLLPGMLAYMETSDPGMHTTDTVDFEVVLAGTVVLELDDGAEVTLQPGDAVVQNGTRHRWRNPGSEPARLAVFICGAHHDAIARPSSS